VDAPAAAASAAPPGWPDRPAQADEEERLVHEVARGDWMWHLAGRYLGDERRYPEIAALNPEYARRYPGYPDHIRPGDRLVLPPGAYDRGPRPHATGPVADTASGSPPAGPDAVAEPPPVAAAEPTVDRDADTDAPSPATSADESPSEESPTRAQPSAGSSAETQPTAAWTLPPPPATPVVPPPPAGTHHPGPTAAPGGAGGTAATPGGQPAAPHLAPLVTGGVLASVLLVAVAMRRRRRMAHRRYGHAASGPAHAPAEASLRAAADADVERLDRALRHLSATGVAADVGAVWVAGGDIHLILASPCAPPAPFEADQAGDWVFPAAADLPGPIGAPSPLPALATVGSSPGRHLLVDLERLGTLTLAGDPERCQDLLRHLVAELAHNLWSELVEVTLASFPPDEARILASLNPDRVRVVESLVTAVAESRRRLAHTTRALETHGLAGTLEGRVSDTATDSWSPRLLVVYGGTGPAPGHDRLLAELRAEIAAAGRRCGVALVTTGGGGAATGRGVLTIGPDGMLSAGFLDGTAVPAAGLPAHLLGPYAGLVRDAAGFGGQTDAPAPGVLLADTPVVPLPVVVPGVATDTAATDGGPRVEILGPVLVTASGPPPDRRVRLCQELVVYLAARGRRGATAAEIDADLWPGQRVPPSVRTGVIATTRRWLGDTAAGEPWLPDADGDGRYRLREGVTVDWHLFAWWRARGHHRGQAGRADLRAALRLVRGEPLAGCAAPAAGGIRPAYSWLPGTRFDPPRVVAGILDAAHDLVDRCLEVDDVDTARWAVEQAWLADPARCDDHPWRDLLRISRAAGDREQVREVVTELLRWRDADHPDELSPATRELVASLELTRPNTG
jgi:hypothetical protein